MIITNTRSNLQRRYYRRILDFHKVISREAYANIYGPTTGDKIRLGDTNLYAEIERDCATYGDECVFGGGKVIRDGMGQTCGCQPADSLDTVITNAVIIDYTGIFKSDIGIKDGIIFALGKAGNRDMMDGVCPDMVVGVSLYSIWCLLVLIIFLLYLQCFMCNRRQILRL